MTHIYNPSTDPYFNLALEEHLLKNRPGEEFFMLWRNSPAVICGRNQNIFEEVDVYSAEEEQIPVVKRFSGGGTVYHDLGNVNYTFITDAPGDGADYGRFIAPVVAALNAMGVAAQLSGVCDITVNGRKISGNAQAQTGGRVLHHGTLLFSCDLARLDRLTGRSRGERGIESKAVKSRVAGVANISEFLPTTLESFMEKLSSRICQAPPVPLSDSDAEAASRLAEEKYRTWKWNGGSSPRFTFKSEHLSYTAYRGVIESASPDHYAPLVGTRLQRADIESALKGSAALVLRGRGNEY